MEILEVSNGFGRILPHTVFKLDSATGFPTNLPVEILEMSDLIDNVAPGNPVQAPPQFPVGAILPDGSQGNHFFFTKFKQAIAVDSVLSSSPSAEVNSSLTGAIVVVLVDAQDDTGSSLINGRAFVNGATYAGTAQGVPATLQLQQWVVVDYDGDGTADGPPRAVDLNTGAIIDPALGPQPGQDAPGWGFPGTQSSTPFQTSAELVSEFAFVFIPDSDGDISTHETFPVGQQLRMRISDGVMAQNGKRLSDEGLASTTVGPDTIPPEIIEFGPGDLEFNVDPDKPLSLKFSESIQLTSVGSLPDGTVPSVGAAVVVTFGPSASTVNMPFTVEPVSVYDLSELILRPVYSLPGSGPAEVFCTTFSGVNVLVTPGQVADLSANVNILGNDVTFTTGQGKGLVNSVVLPDAVYIGRAGADPALSVVDLNGYGQGTGNPTFDAQESVEGNTNFPNNLNVALQGASLIPPLKFGTCTVDGGSAGIFRLQLDSNLNDNLIQDLEIDSVSDMAIGHALDSLFNNGPPPQGCQAGGGNNCSSPGRKSVVPVPNGNTVIPAAAQQFAANYLGAENLVSWAPHPNPPPLVFPPACLDPFIGGQEPTSIDTLGLGIVNQLVPGNFPLGQPQGTPAGSAPPTPGFATLVKEQNAFFQGPSPPQPTPAACLDYGIRQQIGHYLYIADRVRNEVVVLNSNRFTVIERISVPDPTDLAMGTNLDFLAVSNQSANSVSFIAINPTSSAFHTLVKTVQVGKGPTGITWEPDNEDVLVCNTADNSVSIIAVSSLTVRKTLKNQLSQPFDVAVTPRQTAFGLLRNVYFAYILNKDGSISIYESGPDGQNGWGFDDIIGQPEFDFDNPKAIQPDHKNLASGVWVCHENQIDQDGKPTGLGGGAISNMVVESGTVGQIPLDQGSVFANPTIRDIEYGIKVSIGSDQLTGIPVDLCFDNQMNLGALPNVANVFSAGSPAPFNGKNLVRVVGPVFVKCNTPTFLFAAVPNSIQGGGVVDVLDLDESGGLRYDVNLFKPGTQSIDAPGVALLMDYWRQ